MGLNVRKFPVEKHVDRLLGVARVGLHRLDDLSIVEAHAQVLYHLGYLGDLVFELLLGKLGAERTGVGHSSTHDVLGLGVSVELVGLGG